MKGEIKHGVTIQLKFWVYNNSGIGSELGTLWVNDFVPRRAVVPISEVK